MNIAKLLLIVFAVIVLAVSASIGVRMGTKKADTESSVAASKEAMRKAAEQSTVADSKYKPGNYKIQTGGYTLLLREKPSKSASDRREIPDKTVIKVTEVSEATEAADENYRYWGKTQYDGEVGWVPMGYLVETDESPVEDDQENTEQESEEADEGDAEQNESESD